MGALAALALGLPGCAPTRPASPEAPPNIVILVADDLGWGDVGFHVDSISTPNLDGLARDGLRLERFYSAPACTPTRVGLMTGHYPDRYGLRRGVINPSDIRGLPPEAETFAEALAGAGYEHRAALGKWHLGHTSTSYHPLNQGFTEFYGAYTGAIDYFTHLRSGELDWHRNFDASHDEGYSTDLLGAEAERFIERASGDAPFLLYLSFNAVHGPLQAKREDLDRQGFDPAGQTYRGHTPEQHAAAVAAGQQGSIGRGNTLRQTYLAALTSMDQAIGRVLAALEAQGVAENTLVLFLSDNGGPEDVGADNGPLRGAKGSVWEGGVRVPAIARWPARLEAGREVHDLIAFVDLMPTLRRVAGLPAAAEGTFDGVDVLDVLTGTRAGADRLVYLGYVAGDAVVSPDWKYVQGELFDMDADPFETTDVASAHPDVVARMESALRGFRSIERPPAENFDGQYNPVPHEWKMPDRKIGEPL